MGLIYEPLKKHLIKFRYYAWAPDHRSKKYYEDYFLYISDLKGYFLKIPGAGSLVGYGRPKPHENFAFSAKIIFEWTDQVSLTSKEFDNVHQFCDFLKEYPVLAKAVDFVPKI